MMSLSRFLIALLALVVVPSGLRAQDAGEVPYWAAIRSSVVNMRVGPGEDYRIAWVYKRPQLPVKVLRVMDGWRLVQEPDGTRGWMLARFLTRERGGIVRGQGLAEMRESGESGSKLLWRLEPGVVGALGDCAEGWCRFSIGTRTGYVRQERIWGAGAP